MQFKENHQPQFLAYLYTKDKILYFKPKRIVDQFFTLGEAFEKL